MFLISKMLSHLQKLVIPAGTDICSCNICIPHIPVGYAGIQSQGW